MTRKLPGVASLCWFLPAVFQYGCSSSKPSAASVAVLALDLRLFRVTISFPTSIGWAKLRPFCVGASLLEAMKHSPQVTSMISGGHIWWGGPNTGDKVRRNTEFVPSKHSKYCGGKGWMRTLHCLELVGYFPLIYFSRRCNFIGIFQTSCRWAKFICSGDGLL